MTESASYPQFEGNEKAPSIIAIDTLRRQRRDLPTPFGLRLSGTKPGEILTCTAVLRHLPGKRLVCWATRPDGQSVIVKIFLAPRHARRHHKREHEGIAALSAAQVPTPPLMASTTLDDGQTPVVVTAAIPEARSLADCWPDLDDGQRRNCVLSCTRLIAQMHAAGYGQRDIHPGNFLIAGRKTFLIDGDAVRPLTVWPLGNEQRSLANLACFLVQFDPDADRWAKLVLQAYAGQRGWPRQSNRLRSLEGWMRHCRRRRIRRRAAKVTRSCSDIVVRRDWRRYVAWDRAWYSAEFKPLLDDPDRFVRSGHRIKDGNTATVARIHFQDQALIIKRYNIKDLWHRLRRCLRPSRGRIAWRNAHLLRLIGVDTPLPRALIEERWGPFRARAFLICAHQPGPHLADYWRDDWGAHDPRRDALAPLATLIQLLYAARISHGDMKATNLIVDDGRVFLMDLDGLRPHWRSSVFARHFRKDCDRLLRNWPHHPNIRQALHRTFHQTWTSGGRPVD